MGEPAGVSVLARSFSHLQTLSPLDRCRIFLKICWPIGRINGELEKFPFWQLRLLKIRKVSCLILPQFRRCSEMAKPPQHHEDAKTSCTPTGSSFPATKRRKLTGRAFYESIGSPKYVLAPMVDQSEFVRFHFQSISPHVVY